MIFRVVGSRVAVDFDELLPHVWQEEAVRILHDRGFQEIHVDLEEEARELMKNQTVGFPNTTYLRNARMRETPRIFNCSSLTKWLYGRRGVWIPRRTVQQRAIGKRVELYELQPGDLIFKTGAFNYYDNDIKDGVGHVGVFTEKRTVIHAINSRPPIVETSLQEYTEKNGEYRGAVRIICNPESVVTFTFPSGFEIETSDDMKWLILGLLRPDSQDDLTNPVDML